MPSSVKARATSLTTASRLSVSLRYGRAYNWRTSTASATTTAPGGCILEMGTQPGTDTSQRWKHDALRGGNSVTGSGTGSVHKNCTRI